MDGSDRTFQFLGKPVTLIVGNLHSQATSSLSDLQPDFAKAHHA